MPDFTLKSESEAQPTIKESWKWTTKAVKRIFAFESIGLRMPAFFSHAHKSRVQTCLMTLHYAALTQVKDPSQVREHQPIMPANLVLKPTPAQMPCWNEHASGCATLGACFRLCDARSMR